MLAKPPTGNDDERASKLDNIEREYLSKNIYEDRRESSPSMMSSSWARENAVCVSSSEKVGLEHHGGGFSSLDRPNMGPVSATGESCTQDGLSMGLALAAGILFSRPSTPSSSVRKSCKNKAVKGSVPELLHNQGPSFDSGSIGNSIIENMNRIFLARQHPFSAKEIWEGGKMLGATPVSDEVDIVARITTMEE
ncbi:hypothetical protein Ancab_008397 [Ancistrocladus abbreviatus]